MSTVNFPEEILFNPQLDHLLHREAKRDCGYPVRLCSTTNATKTFCENSSPEYWKSLGLTALDDHGISSYNEYSSKCKDVSASSILQNIGQKIPGIDDPNPHWNYESISGTYFNRLFEGRERAARSRPGGPEHRGYNLAIEKYAAKRNTLVTPRILGNAVNYMKPWNDKLFEILVAKYVADSEQLPRNLRMGYIDTQKGRYDDLSRAVRQSRHTNKYAIQFLKEKGLVTTDFPSGLYGQNRYF